MITVALIEDNRLVREGISSLLNQLPDLMVTGNSSTAEPMMLQGANPQVILLDLGLRNGDSLRIAKRVMEDFPAASVVVMDLLPLHEDVMEFVAAGVAGFMMKDASVEDLVSAIRAVARGEKVLPPQMVDSLFSQIAKNAVQRDGPQALAAVRMTPRERQVVNLIAEGLSNKEIGKRLRIATHTVKSHVRNIMEKLTLHTRLQIAAYSHKNTPEGKE